MGPTAFLFSALLLNPGGLLGTSLAPPDPGLVPEAMVSAHPTLLPNEVLSATTVPHVDRDTLLAQRRRATPHPSTSEQAADTEGLPGSSPSPSPSASPPAAPSEASSTESTPAAPAAAGSSEESCTDIDCEAYHEAERNSHYVLHRRTRLLRTHRAFAIAAWSMMVVTEAIGTVLAYNQDTWFGRGACSSNPSSFGCSNESLLVGLHETAAFVTEGLYTTAGVLAVAAPDPENASEGSGDAESTLRLHKLMAYIHGAGMIALPLLGVLSEYPQMVGVTSNEGRADLSRATRSLHTIIGYTTLAALTFSFYLEL